MAETVIINLRQVARGLAVPLRQVEAVVELLDDGNTVPFITRYRKDQTGGLDEEQIRLIQGRLTKARLLAQRKQTILRSIESQGRLTPELAEEIQAAGTTKRLEDLYLPYKPRKQTLATTARSRGLDPLAEEILRADPACANLDARAADFVNPDKQVPTGGDALLGAGHILAEMISERAELRQRLREILYRTGRIVSTRAGAGPEPKPLPAEPVRTEPAPAAPPPSPAGPPASPPEIDGPSRVPEPCATPAADAEEQGSGEGGGEADPPVALPDVEAASAPAVVEEQPGEGAVEPPIQSEGPPESRPELAPEAPVGPAPEAVPGFASEAPPAEAAGPASGPPTAAAPRPARPKPRARPSKAEVRRPKKDHKKKREEERRQKAFADYFDYQEDLKKVPPHRVLAINRAERAKVVRVRVECDLEAMYQVLDEECVPPGHPHADFLRGCARDALVRLVLPGLERELRREMTEKAETHAVEVFAKNLRKLLLQPPVRGRRVLAVDPGYKSGCKLVALDQFGNVLDRAVIYLVGKPEHREEARKKVAELVDRYQLTVAAIGNGTACRETEDFFAELIGGELKEKDLRYVIVNEAGASVYSTSRVGREELPDYDASVRGAVSIGRRLQDPLSELVKIEPANIGVGLYQHDVKAKHLQASLEEVVESCVNYVGVDVNTASPSLLRCVSGLNQLTARRVYEHRMARGPFRNRQQLREVQGFGDATFVQAAGFLKIASGDEPLDATWIHPESYPAARKLLEKLGCVPEELLTAGAAAGLAERTAGLDAEALAAELGVGAFALRDIVAQFLRPGRDPREDLPPPVFKRGVLKIEDLAPGMELTGTVLNVVDFGAFVDIGMHDSGLVHVSQMAERFVRDPHEVIAVGEVVKVWVVKVDKERRRVSLTMVAPGKRERPAPAPRPEGRPPPKPRPEQGGRPQGRPPQRGRGGPPRGGARPAPRPEYKPKPRPQPLTPLTEGMKKGDEPMRTFGDLLQFFRLSRQQADEGQAPDGPNTGAPDKPEDGPKDGPEGPGTQNA